MLHKLRVIQSIRARDNRVRLSVALRSFVPFASANEGRFRGLYTVFDESAGSLSTATSADSDSGHSPIQHALLNALLSFSFSFRILPNLPTVSRYATRLSTMKLRHSGCHSAHIAARKSFFFHPSPDFLLSSLVFLGDRFKHSIFLPFLSLFSSGRNDIYYVIKK